MPICKTCKKDEYLILRSSGQCHDCEEKSEQIKSSIDKAMHDVRMITLQQVLATFESLALAIDGLRIDVIRNVLTDLMEQD